MELDGADPATVNKNPKIIKGAQEDAAKLDILVCGICRNVFHFVEEFKEHKQEACPSSSFNAQETKPQVWAFLLWKSAIVNRERSDANISSWKMYQRWSKMDQDIRENWITAGKALQSFSILANAKLQEIRSPSDGKNQLTNARPDETDNKAENTVDSKSDRKKPGLSAEKHIDLTKSIFKPENGSNSSSDDMKCKLVCNSSSSSEKTTLGSVKENHENKMEIQEHSEENGEAGKKISMEDDSIEIKEEKLSEEEGSRGAWDVNDLDETSLILSASSEVPAVKKRSEPLPGSNKVTRRSLNRSIDGSSEDEYVVEKILAKRFNPKKKHYEYLLKWEGYPHEQNTWEPVHNMAACDKLVETFEHNLAKQKAAQAQQQAQKVIASAQSISRKLVPASREHKAIDPGPSNVESGRPVRSSKKKALEQVKSWCGSMAKTTEFGKRKVGESSDSDDDDDISEKKVKLEPRDDDEWSGGELQCSQGSSGEENVVAVHGNQTKVVGVIHKAKEQLFSPVVKRSPGRPRKVRIDETNVINGLKSRKEDSNELAVKLGLESDSSPESKAKSPMGNKAGQPPVLVANSKGVIKVDPRQVPNLTSGVYIVANKSNVVKLESLPGSPTKGKVVTTKSPTTKLLEGSVKSGGTSGLIRKSGIVQGSGSTRLRPLAPAPPPVKLLPKTSSNQLAGVLLGGPGLMKVAPQLQQRTVLPASPRGVTSSSPRILGPRPSAVLQPRGNIVQSSLRPSTPNALSTKRPIGIPGVQTKITSAVRPRLPTAGKLVSPLTAQTKSGVKPIHAMLGKAVQGQSLAASGLLGLKKNGEGVVKQGERMTIATVKPGVRIEEEKSRKTLGRGRGRGGGLGVGNDTLSKLRENKLSESESSHMEFNEASSSESDSGDSLPDIPMGELPSLEPESPPRPFTLCPETGKILSRAEGEPSPPLSPAKPAADTPLTSSGPVPISGPTPVVCKDIVAGSGPGASEAEEILPDKREPPSPVSYSDGGETLLKVEMSPGGTTGTVIESSVSDSQYVDTLRTEQGVTVTKISAELGVKSPGQTVNAQSVTANQVVGKPGGGISVPARKLFMEGNKLSAGEVVTVTGEDGVVYQIATEGQEEIEGAEGMQQCVYVTTDQAEGAEEGTVLTLDTAVAEAVAQLMPDQVNVIGDGCSQFYIKDGEDNNVPSDNNEQLVMATVADQSATDENAQVVAHVVQEGEIIPGTGKRQVVLLLPDGNLMMTDVDEEQYAALNLDK